VAKKKSIKLQEMHPKGADEPREIYQAVGVALSWWEASEDEILGLFKLLCEATEPVAIESFIQAPRAVRGSMLKFAIETYAHRFNEGEAKVVYKAMEKLDILARTRNEIAHGHCSTQTVQIDGDVVASGNYLLPSLNEGEFHERSLRFNHIPETIYAFVEKVREQRGKIMDVRTQIITRDQQQQHMAEATVRHHVGRVARMELQGDEAIDELRKLIGWIDETERMFGSNAD